MTAVAADRPTAEPPVAAAAHTEDAVKIYGKGATEVRALDGVTVGFADGELGAIMGPSGSGKSTLLHCMAGLDTLTSGRAFIGDQDLGALDDKDLTVLRRDRIGLSSRRSTWSLPSLRTRTSPCPWRWPAVRASGAGSTRW